MFGVEDDDLEIHYDRKQGLYTPYDDKRDDDESCYTIFWSSNLLSLDGPKYNM